MGEKLGIFKYCKEGLRSRTILKNILSDIFKENKLAINLVLMTFDSGIIGRIDNARIIDNDFFAKSVIYFTRNCGITEEAAKAAVKFWISEYAYKCLGRVVSCPAVKENQKNGDISTPYTKNQNQALELNTQSGKRINTKTGLNKKSLDWSSNRYPGQEKKLNIGDLSFVFRWCPPGEFLMGNRDNKNRRDDELLHKVVLTKGFWILETPVTQKMWRSVVGGSVRSLGFNPSKSRLNLINLDYPIFYVNLRDCDRFCRKFEKLTGKKIVLPTEAQWEYACRAGCYQNIDDSNILQKKAWFKSNSNRTLHAVKLKEPNPWGIYDMLGNVNEWCQDLYDPDFYKESPVFDPTGPKRGGMVVVRGGSWSDNADCCKASSRECEWANARHVDLGFRPIIT